MTRIPVWAFRREHFLKADVSCLCAAGRENDGTGLYYYRARYCDPALKRFVSEDPIGLAGGINAYSYVGGNPISRTDPLGLLYVAVRAYTNMFIVFHQPDKGWDPPSFEGIYEIDNAPCYVFCFFPDQQWEEMRWP